MVDIQAEVTFYVKDDSVPALLEKAAQVDRDENGQVEESYTVPQALQVVWHAEPEWLHTRALDGWTLDKTRNESGTMRPIWGRDE